MNKQILESDLYKAAEELVLSLRANKDEGFHGSIEDKEHFEVLLNEHLQKLEAVIAKIMWQQ